MKICPLYNFSTFADIFTNFGSNIKAWSVNVWRTIVSPRWGELGNGYGVWGGGMIGCDTSVLFQTKASFI